LELEVKPKISDEVKQWLDPVYLGLLKPLSKISPGFEDQVTPGFYYYFPFFSDTRIYRETLNHESFSLFLEDFDELSFFIENLVILKE
jgi:hypothetical protein